MVDSRTMGLIRETDVDECNDLRVCGSIVNIPSSQISCSRRAHDRTMLASSKKPYDAQESC